ncbi:MAG: winged helix-turn-helix domain-containing protein [Gemmatimonadetes bacterium]|nr:winged helix-turn-helix domain-containing protein [Gemmatimonadota bacterium]
MAHRRDEIADVLRQRVVGGLHLGLLKPGSRLPSVRTLAVEFDSDPRVVLAGYRQLELDGLVELRPRSGIFVADSAVSGGEMFPQTSEWVVGVLVQALSRGVPPVEFPERVRGCLKTVRVTAACIECNGDQIAGLCEELGRDYGLVTTPIDITRLRGSVAPAEVADADLLVTTSYHAAEVQHLAERLSKSWIAVSLRPEFVAEAIRLLEHGELYFVASDPRFAEKLPTMFASAPGVERLRVLVVGRDDISTIPPNAPTYVMAAARRQLANLPLLARVIPAPRVFSPESAQALLRFIVSANIAAIRERESAELESIAAR